MISLLLPHHHVLKINWYYVLHSTNKGTYLCDVNEGKIRKAQEKRTTHTHTPTISGLLIFPSFGDL